MKGSCGTSSSGQNGTDCRKEGSTLETTDVENVSSENADMRGGGSKE